MPQPPYAKTGGPSYAIFKELPHYRGPPVVDGKKVPKEMEKPSKWMGKNPEGGNHKTAYADPKNEHPDHPANGFDDWGAKPIGYEGWKHAGTNVKPADYNPISKDTPRGERSIEIIKERLLNSGEGFTQVNLMVSIDSYNGDMNYAGVSASEQWNNRDDKPGYHHAVERAKSTYSGGEGIIPGKKQKEQHPEHASGQAKGADIHDANSKATQETAHQKEETRHHANDNTPEGHGSFMGNENEGATGDDESSKNKVNPIGRFFARKTAGAAIGSAFRGLERIVAKAA